MGTLFTLPSSSPKTIRSRCAKWEFLIPLPPCQVHPPLPSCHCPPPPSARSAFPYKVARGTCTLLLSSTTMFLLSHVSTLSSSTSMIFSLLLLLLLMMMMMIIIIIIMNLWVVPIIQLSLSEYETANKSTPFQHHHHNHHHQSQRRRNCVFWEFHSFSPLDN